MLGVTTYEGVGPADALLREFAEETGVGETWKNTRVGVFFGPAGEEVDDPYFGGEGPRRTGCVRCGQCMIGCRYGAKNTLRKNYLWFAEKLGVKIQSERQVVDIKPLGARGRRRGLRVDHRALGSLVSQAPRDDPRPRHRARRRRARHQQAAARLQAARLAAAGLRPPRRAGAHQQRVGDGGHRARFDAATSRTRWRSRRASTRTRTPTSRSSPTARARDSMSLLFTLMTGDGTRLTRPVLWLKQAIRHPLKLLRTLWPFGWSQRTVILLIMQSLDNAIRLVPKRRLLGRGVRLQTEQDPERPNPTYIPVANQVTELVRGADRRLRPGRADRVTGEHPDHRPHPRRRRDRLRPGHRRDRPGQPGVRLREPAGLRRRRRARRTPASTRR